MSKKAQDNVFCLVVLIVLLAFTVFTLQLGSARARMVPLPVAVISILLLLLQLYFQNFRPDVKLNVDSVDLFQITDDTVEAEEEIEDFTKKSRAHGHGELTTFAVVLGLLAMVVLLGILEATFLFTVGYMLWYGKEKIHLALAWAIGSTAAFYLLFFRIVSLEPWEGWIRLTFFS